MPWIDEMLSVTRLNKASESAKRKVGHSSSSDAEKVDKQISAGKDAWADLIAALRADVKDFNNHSTRVGHSPALMSGQSLALARFQFEVYVPEMNSRLLVLTLTGNSLYVNGRPQFSVQPLTITLESAENGKHYGWFLDGTGKEKKQVSVEQLSEYLLKPILASSEID
jgi:hypothetical protein